MLKPPRNPATLPQERVPNPWQPQGLCCASSKMENIPSVGMEADRLNPSGYSSWCIRLGGGELGTHYYPRASCCLSLAQAKMGTEDSRPAQGKARSRAQL